MKDESKKEKYATDTRKESDNPLFYCTANCLDLTSFTLDLTRAAEHLGEMPIAFKSPLVAQVRVVILWYCHCQPFLDSAGTYPSAPQRLLLLLNWLELSWSSDDQKQLLHHSLERLNLVATVELVKEKKLAWEKDREKALNDWFLPLEKTKA